MTISTVAVPLPGERMVTKYTGSRERPSPDEIARLAYRFYETRGRADGHAVEDWLSAEQELTRLYALAIGPVTTEVAARSYRYRNGKSQNGKGQRS